MENHDKNSAKIYKHLFILISFLHLQTFNFLKMQLRQQKKIKIL